MREDSCTCRLISVTDEVISSVAEATDWTLVEASSDAEATMPDSSWVTSAVLVSVPAVASSSVAAVETVSTMPPTVPWNWSASLSMSALRCATARCSACFCSASSASIWISFSLKVFAARALSPTSSPRSA